jgi:hypothetical protein
VTAGNNLQPIADWLLDQLHTFGPGVVFVAVSKATWLLLDRLAERHQRRRGIRRLQQYANPQGSRALLDELHPPRKENPQP